jgi:crotonobetainyl-CoA:carnitine CoA-transferase CaiB-like acyl-CoA transferase
VPDRALEGVSAVEIGSSIATMYAGKLLADLGAHVVLVEPPEGHPLRQVGPGQPGAAHSGLFAHMATNRQSFVYGGSQDDRADLERVVAGADILIADGTTEAERALAGRVPEFVVHVDVSPFGR